MTRTANHPVQEQGKLRRALGAVWAFVQAMESAGCDHALCRIERLEREVRGLNASFDAATNAWLFVPAAPWAPGRYALMTHPDLEDASGNRTCAPFEGPHASLARCEAGAATAFDIAPG